MSSPNKWRACDTPAAREGASGGADNIVLVPPALVRDQWEQMFSHVFPKPRRAPASNLALGTIGVVLSLERPSRNSLAIERPDRMIPIAMVRARLFVAPLCRGRNSEGLLVAATVWPRRQGTNRSIGNWTRAIRMMMIALVAISRHDRALHAANLASYRCFATDSRLDVRRASWRRRGCDLLASSPTHIAHKHKTHLRGPDIDRACRRRLSRAPRPRQNKQNLKSARRTWRLFVTPIRVRFRRPIP